MPPRKLLKSVSVKPMRPAEINTLVRWINAGAPTATRQPDVATATPDPLVTSDDRGFWSFRSPRAVSVPSWSRGDQAGNPIAAFILDKLVNHPNLCLIFDGGNLSSQNFTPVETIAEFRAMKSGIGWLHIKDYKIDSGLKWTGFVDEERLKNFEPADEGDSGHEEILRDFKARVPGLERKLKKQGVPGVFFS